MNTKENKENKHNITHEIKHSITQYALKIYQEEL